jgi:pimeloyl-ACP methyl ester carboxylesterase
VLSGHSRGAAIAARTVYAHEDLFAGLILIGTSHPKEANYSLADAQLPITKIYGTEDGLASPSEVEAFRSYLPEHTIMTEIAGGNHAQFGYYGTQLGDSKATISREEQQAETAVTLLTFLDPLNP